MALTDERERAVRPEARPEYLPLERYGLVGECGTAALVSDDGSIDWLCLPRFDSDPVFARILDPQAGHFWIRPSEPFTTTRTYLPDTPVLATTFRSGGGQATLYDFFAARPFEQKRRHLWPFRYLVRRIEGEAGTVPLEVEVAPRHPFGGLRFRLRTDGHRLVATTGRHTLLLESTVPWTVDGESARARLEVASNERAYVTLAFDDGQAILPPAGEFAERTFHETIEYWKRWAAVEELEGRHAQMVRRSALTLKLLTFAPSGAVVAAPTTSLPETIGGSRNWDYRYVWLRDASRTVVALFDLGYEPEAAAYAYWVLNATSLTVPRVRTLYGVHGEDPRDEREVPGLRGYLDSLPVRQGNQAEDQLQLDNWGQLVDAVYTLAHRSGNMDRGTWRSVRAFVEFVRENWRQPDQGIWEIRSGRRHLVHSKIMCWVALDRGARLIRGFGLPGPAEEWEREAEEIRRTVLERGVDHERGSLVRAFGDTAMDASLLEAAVVRFLPGDDPLMVRTIDRIREELGHEDLVYRYRVEDGMPGQEGAFLPCSFWLVQALALAGKKDEAEELYDRVCERANDLGLFPEEIDPDTGRFLGNFPQGLTHIALVNAAATLNRAGGGDG